MLHVVLSFMSPPSEMPQDAQHATDSKAALMIEIQDNINTRWLVSLLPLEYQRGSDSLVFSCLEVKSEAADESWKIQCRVCTKY